MLAESHAANNPMIKLNDITHGKYLILIWFSRTAEELEVDRNVWRRLQALNFRILLPRARTNTCVNTHIRSDRRFCALNRIVYPDPTLQKREGEAETEFNIARETSRYRERDFK